MANRACKAGDAFQTEKKLEKKYEEEENLGTPKRIAEWINTVLAEELSVKCTDISYQGLHIFLKDGVVLCKLINKLLENDGFPKVSFRSKATTAFVAMNNIENFNKGAYNFGLPETALFQTTDLYEGRKGPMLNVINCLSQMGMIANAKGFEPIFNTGQAPKADWAKD
ncbi:DgyrCDS13609 [Dimorphilus gyrociliatus]|uniref:DgyrCDS13609 n=1 Tax=Dimorphilus gyrociliatus TaxID=2664684 RepID=A0A7I8WB85_9ANNE|nr:DgyrCDS13609 [Dimorphilus gyrociliatus]